MREKLSDEESTKKLGERKKLVVKVHKTEEIPKPQKTGYVFKIKCSYDMCTSSFNDTLLTIDFQ